MKSVHRLLNRRVISTFIAYSALIFVYFVFQFNISRSNYQSYLLFLHQALIITTGAFVIPVFIKSQLDAGFKILGCAITALVILFFTASLISNLRIQQRLCPDDLTGFTRFSVTTEDNIDISGIMRRENHPRAIIISHGVADNKYGCQLLVLANKLSEEFDVYLFDFRGYGESRGESTFGYLEVRDLEAVFDFVYSSGYSSVGIIGNSMGGVITIEFAANHDHVGGVVVVGTPAGLDNLQGSEVQALPLLLDNSIGRGIYRIFSQIPVSKLVGQVDIEERAERSPINLIARLSPIPVLIIHGENDSMVPVQNAYLLFERAGEPKEIKIYEEGGHGITDLYKQFGDSFGQEILDWLDKNLH